MTRNIKIALGCGGAGCLGLILLVILIAILIFTGVIAAPGIYSPNSNSNYNSNYNYNSNSNSNTNESPNTNSESPSSSSMSDSDKHKLFQAAGISGDSILIQKVMRKLGFTTASGSEYEQFVKDHGPWALNNIEFVQSILTPEKARAYVEAHIDD